MIRTNARIAAVIISSSCYSIGFCSEKEGRLQEISDVTRRLRLGFPCDQSNSNIIFRRESSDGLKYFSPKLGKLGLPNCRIATCEIRAPAEEICSSWLAQDRSSWEPQNCLSCQIIKNPALDTPIYYVSTQPTYLAPSRDFAFIMDKIPGSVVGLTDYRSAIFVTVNKPNGVPKAWNTVRSHRNSILIIEPKTSTKTKVTYIIEVDDGGWFHPFFVDWTADSYMDTLIGLKKEMEKSEIEDEKNKSIEEIAKLRFQKSQDKLKKLENVTLVDDVTASKNDLINTVQLLEKRLNDIRKSERTEGLDLRELRSRVELDLKKAKDRLKAM